MATLNFRREIPLRHEINTGVTEGLDLDTRGLQAELRTQRACLPEQMSA